MLSRYVLPLGDLLPSREVSEACCLLGIVNCRVPNAPFQTRRLSKPVHGIGELNRRRWHAVEHTGAQQAGDSFDQTAIAAVMHSTFEPGRLAGKPVPVWIDVRVVFHSDRSDAIPQVLIAERDLPPPGDSQLKDKHHNPLSYTPPVSDSHSRCGFQRPV